MTQLFEKRGPEEFMLSEANGELSRDNVVLDTGNLQPGTILGKLTATGKYVQVDLAANTGAETAVAILCRHVDATAADQKCAVIGRLAEVNQEYLVYPNAASDNDKAAINADLLEKFIKVVT